MAKQYKVTVFIPTWYGERYLDELLSAVFSQKTPFEFDVLVYDTSSGDSTPDIIKKFAKKHDNFRHKTITKAEFGHGKTRQAAAKDSQSEFMVYLSQDATPMNDRWLHEMVKPFLINDNIAAVLGRQEPRSHAIPLLKREIRSVFSGLGPRYATTLYSKDKSTIDDNMLSFLGFYSDVNSAARRSLLIGEIPYRDVPYAEDQLFGRDVISGGYTKAYASEGAVIHSNDLRLSEYRARMFDETIGLRHVGIAVGIPSRQHVIKSVISGIAVDTISILRDPHYSIKRKVYWFIFNPFFHIEKWRGVMSAATADIDNSAEISSHSLESKRDVKNQTRH